MPKGGDCLLQPFLDLVTAKGTRKGELGFNLQKTERPKKKKKKDLELELELELEGPRLLINPSSLYLSIMQI